MKVGDTVKHKDQPKYGKGKIISFQVKMGTVLVKFEKCKDHSYHSPWVLVSHSK